MSKLLQRGRGEETTTYGRLESSSEPAASFGVLVPASGAGETDASSERERSRMRVAGLLRFLILTSPSVDMVRDLGGWWRLRFALLRELQVQGAAQPHVDLGRSCMNELCDSTNE